MNNSSRRIFIGRAMSFAIIGTGLFSFARDKEFRQQVFAAASSWNDITQGWLYSEKRLAPTFKESEISQDFPSNLFYPESYIPDIKHDTWSLRLGGKIQQTTSISLPELRAMQQEQQITQLICIEGWSAIGQWSGVPLATLLKKIGADTNSAVVRFDCADGYFTSIDMASALHPQTILALDFMGQPLEPAFGAPVRLRIPTKLGFKNAKFLTGISVHDQAQGGYWEDQGYNWFAGL